MANEGSVDTFEYTIAGRTMVFRKTSQGQLLMLERMARSIMAQMQDLGPGEPEKVAELGGRLNEMAFEVAESRFTSPQDLEFVRLEVLRGNVSEDEIFRIFANGAPRSVPAPDDGDPVPAKKPRKVAATKAAKRAPVQRGAR